MSKDDHTHGSGGLCCGASPASKAAKTTRKSGGFEKRYRDYLMRTNLDLILIVLLLAWYHARAADAAESTEDDGHGGGHETEEEASFLSHNSEVMAILFPWFSEIVGVFAYYVLSRYAHAIPYTAVMFLIGTAIGCSVHWKENAITFSASTWIGIEGEVILLVFLPGLLYLDSYHIDVHLFLASFWQLIIFAFPMVLAGTSLTALVAYYIFPYGWSLDLSMTFGSILAATDPVAVAVLLNELGAPPRLKMHVSGESLMNDGSAVVFYNIFSARFLFELGINGVGSDIGWVEGFTLFFRLSLGGLCIGIAFGVGLLIILYNLDRRLSGEDSVVQVVATVATAYLAFFTSEILCQCSGIIAVVFCGVTVKAFGETLYNDSHLSDHFWEITEYLLNTLLFTLGGCVWGDLIAGEADSGGGQFRGEDWAYLILLYALITIIRFFLVFAFFPITSQIGIGTNWREAVFMSYGGLRGAVGIALALSLHAEVEHATNAATDEQMSPEEKIQFREFTGKLFGMVGGVALLTLVINGPTSGPLLKRLGLITPTETRKKVIDNYYQHMVQYVLKEYVSLLTEKRFHDVDFSVVKEHIPFLRDTTYEQLTNAVRKLEHSTPAKSYTKPNLRHVIPYIYHSEEYVNLKTVDDDDANNQISRSSRRTQMLKNRRESVRGIRESNGNRHTIFDLRVRYDERTVQEERLVFIKILRSAYFRLVEHGELKARGFIVHSLTQSLDYAEDAASRGLPLEDWNALEVASDSFARPTAHMMRKLFNLKQRIKHKKYHIGLDLDYFVVSVRVRQILVFTHAHDWARKIFKEEFSKGGMNALTAAEKIVLDESDEQVEMADALLSKLDKTDVGIVKSHYACQILLNRAAYYFKKLKKHGLMTEREAGGFLEEIEESITEMLECRETIHDNEMTVGHKCRRLSSIPQHILEHWDLFDGASKRNIYESDDQVSKKNVSGSDDENPPENEEAAQSFGLSGSEKKVTWIDGSEVMMSEKEIEAINNTDVM